jgi:hypothetical protein
MGGKSLIFVTCDALSAPFTCQFATSTKCVYLSKFEKYKERLQAHSENYIDLKIIFQNVLILT